MLGVAGHHQHHPVPGADPEVAQGRRHPPSGVVEGGVGRGAAEEDEGGSVPMLPDRGLELFHQCRVSVVEVARNARTVRDAPERFCSFRWISFVSSEPASSKVPKPGT